MFVNYSIVYCFEYFEFNTQVIFKLNYLHFVTYFSGIFLEDPTNNMEKSNITSGPVIKCIPAINFVQKIGVYESKNVSLDHDFYYE